MVEYAAHVTKPLIADDESNGAEIMQLKTAYDAEVTDNMRLREALDYAKRALRKGDPMLAEIERLEAGEK
jgi:hypothetical protein